MRKAREAADLTLDDLHQRTRISLKNLRLIESGDFPSIPQTYVRAFVREFARTVGLDEENIVGAYNEAAEREKGIPIPPAPIDSSNLLPKVDDSVEFVLPSDHPPSHVEVNGTAEVEVEDFVLPVRKSSYVREGDAAAIDIRTSVAFDTEAAPAPQKPDTANALTAPPEKEAPSPPASSAHTQADTASLLPPPGNLDPVPEYRKPEAVKPPPPPPIPLPPLDGGNEKRIIGMGLVVIAMIAIAIYGIFFFSSSGGDESAAVDSTSIKASIEAGRFIDSSQYALTELNINPEDTATGIPVTPPIPVEAQKRVFAREDSLVLEAFTSAPVWFSVKMDTLRTERGSLSSNEHRIWKARDYFMITLGDAGAVTFFLNGKEIGTLGEEGTIVKNFTLSRQQLNGN
ncbi:MAG: helix-turn-helix domain-containing protein [Bacteroidota bacterium]